MKSIILAMPGSEKIARRLASKLDARLGLLEIRRFPDGESYVRVKARLAGFRVIVVAALDRPDEKFLPLIFLAGTARDLGATDVGLVCPYLPYMRQDKRFHQGEAVTSAYFAAALSRAFDWLVTVDPHLHRRRSLGEIYPIPAIAVSAAPLLADWIRKHIKSPLIVGPDGESAQWVRAVAQRAGAPYAVLNKRRSGDRTVKISRLRRNNDDGLTPVLVDDIISTAETMIETVRRVRESGARKPCCVAVHGIFSGNAFQELRDAGAGAIATCNTVPHPSNAIDVTDLLVDGVVEALASYCRALTVTLGFHQGSSSRRGVTSNGRSGACGATGRRGVGDSPLRP